MLVSKKVTSTAAGLLTLLLAANVYAAPIPSEREQMRHAPTFATPAEVRMGLKVAKSLLNEMRRSSFDNPGADAEYRFAVDAAQHENYRLANAQLDNVWVDMREFPFENVNNPRVP